MEKLYIFAKPTSAARWDKLNAIGYFNVSFSGIKTNF